MSEIDLPVALGDLLGCDDLSELAASFARFHGVELTVADVTGALSPDRGDAAPAELRRALARRPRNRALTAGDYQFQLRRLLHDGERVGALAIGPYRTPGPAVQGDGPPAMTDAAAGALADYAVEVLDVLVHNSYVRHLTQAVHVASMNEAYAELQAKTERLERAVVRMQEVDRLKSGFLATMSHELRTPLTSVIGYAEMLLEGLGGPITTEQRDYVETILGKADHLLEMISGILDASMIESGRMPLRREPFVLEKVIDSVVSSFSAQARKRKIRIEVSGADLPPVVGDSRKVRQSLWNLINNAIKFTNEGGAVGVVTAVGGLRRDGAPDDSGVRISISDSGIGIPAERQAQIFEPFFQVDSSSTRQYGGAGLGLTVAKRFVEAQGGSIWVESSPGTGSVFTITLPAVADDDAPK